MKNENKEKLKNMAGDVLTIIKEENIAMKPKYYFAGKTILAGLGIVVVLGLALFLMSLVIFVTRGSGLDTLPYFGARGWTTLFMTLPWILIMAIGSSILLLELLSSHFKFVYQRPVFQSLAALVLVVIGVGWIMGLSSIHERMSDMHERGELPGGGYLYRALQTNPDEDFHAGQITEISDDMFTLTSRNGNDYFVRMSDEVKSTLKRTIETGMHVVIMGDEDEDDIIDAIGVKFLNPDKLHMPKPAREILREKIDRTSSTIRERFRLDPPAQQLQPSR